MHRKLRFCLIQSIILFASISARAETYTLDNCIDIALKNNYGVILAKNTYDAARWNVYSSYGQILPSLSISANHSESWSPAYLYIEGVRTPNPNPGTNITFSDNLSFGQSYAGLGLGTYASIKQQGAQKQSYFYSYVDTRNGLVLSVKEAYYNVTKTKMLVDVATDAVKRGEEQLKVAQSRYDLGSASLSDVLKAKVLRSNAKVDLLTAENNYNLAKANLNFTMGVDVAQDFEVAEDLPERTFDITYSAALSEAIINNPLYRKANFDLDMAKASLLLAKTSFLPTLSFGVTHSSRVPDRNSLFDFNEEYAGRSIYLQLSYSLFNNFTDLSNLIARKKLVNTQKENLDNTKNSVALEVRQAFLDVQLNVEKLNLNEESVAAAQEDLNIVREKYNLGAATIIEVLDAEVSFKQAQTNHVQALFDYNLAISRLEKVMGK
jgi:outer membrane protein